MTTNMQVLLSSRPGAQLSADNFTLSENRIPALEDGQFLVENVYLSLDAGFRQWMNEGASDNYLVAMPLQQPVQSIVLGKVIESRNPAFPQGTTVMGRTAWEQYSIADGTDLMTAVEVVDDIPLHEHLCALGPSGMTAYFGLLDIGHPVAGETVVVSAAAGGVGSIVGQIARIKGCKTVGISSSEEKCAWLRQQLQYDVALNHRGTESLLEQLKREVPGGLDVFFDNVGGEMLDTAMQCLAEHARIVLCGAISQYEKSGQHSGVYHMWELITKRARAEGFMFSDYMDRYPSAIEEISGWIRQGKLKSPVVITDGIDTTAQAFCDMLSGRNLGKCLVRLNRAPS